MQRIQNGILGSRSQFLPIDIIDLIYRLHPYPTDRFTSLH